MLIQHLDEFLAVVWYKKMQSFVEKYIFKTLFWLFREFEIEPDITQLGVAATPTGFHPLQENLINLDTKDFLPLCR